MNPHIIFYFKTLIAAIFMAAICHSEGYAQEEPVKLPPGTVEGRLGNGLHYLILRNGTPASKAEFRLVMRVGSLQQTDTEGGCAHFLEHVAFGPSRHFPGRGKVEYLESLGMKYGQDINAVTGFDRTVYMFSIPTDQDGTKAIERSVLILRDWLDGAMIDSLRVESEKGIILEELRGYDQGDEFYDLKIGDGIYRRRLPLGTADEIRQVTPETLRRFYKRWYRPDLATIIVVGDIDPQQVEQEIVRNFSSCVIADTTACRLVPLEYGQGIRLMRNSDSLRHRTSVELIIPRPCIVQRTCVDALLRQREELLASALSARFRALGLGTQVSDEWYLSDKNHFVLTMEGEQRDILLEQIALTANACKNLVENGWTPEEWEHVKERFCQRIYLPDLSGHSSALLCEDLTDYVLSGDRHLVDSLQFCHVQEEVLATVSGELQEMFAAWLACGEESLLVACREHPGIGAPLTAEEIVAAWRRGMEMPCQPFVYEEPKEREEVHVATPVCLVDCGKFRPEYIRKQTRYSNLGVLDVELANGIRLILKPTPDKSGELLLTSLAPGSLSALTEEEFSVLADMAGYMDATGIAGVHPDTLSTYLYQSNISLMVTVENHWHGFMGMSPVQKAMEFFRLIYEKIYHPEMPYVEVPDTSGTRGGGRESMLAKMLQRDAARQLSACMREMMGETLPQTKAEGCPENFATAEDILAFYQELYTRTEGQTYIICGDFDADTLCRQFVTVFGNAPARAGEKYREVVSFSLPDETVVKGFPHENESQTVFDYLFYGNYKPELRQTLLLKIMRDLIRDRLISVLREERSLVYSPYIGLTYEGIPYATYYFDINASAKNENMEAIDTVLRQILTCLQTEKVGKDELEEIKRSFLIAKRETLTEDASAAWRNTLTNLIKNGEELADFDRYEQCLRSITPDELRKAFRKYIRLEPYVLLYLSNQKINMP